MVTLRQAQCDTIIFVMLSLTKCDLLACTNESCNDLEVIYFYLK